MKRWVLVFLLGCAFSMYIFPFSFSFFPIGNTKIWLAVVGLFLWLGNLAWRQDALVSRSMLKISAWGLLVSLISVFSVTYNGSTDNAYVGYVVSVWVGAAYFLCHIIRKLHKRLDVGLICNYFIGVCVAQCIFALLNEFVPSFNTIVNNFVIQQSHEYLKKVDRMYGIGAAFDTAGTRFSCALIMISYLLTRNLDDRSSYTIYTYIVSFVFISIVGNMIARTTTAGMLLGLVYFVYSSRVFTLKVSSSYIRVVKAFAIIMLIAIPLSFALYSNPNVSALYDYAFKGFIKMARTGTWETGSTNELLLMWAKVPESFKTWVIGDGYFISPYLTNPHYVGYHTWTFYMGTDVGYLRFIYYFGLVGLISFSLFFVVCARECVLNNKTNKALYVMILFMNFIVWAKVATDLFCVFAPFLMMDSIDKEPLIRNEI